MKAGLRGSDQPDSSLSRPRSSPEEELRRLWAEPMVCENTIAPLSGVPFHHDTRCITRFFAKGFPMHLAVHRVSSAEPVLRNYTELHAHPEPEICVFIPDPSGLIYRLQIGTETREVSGHVSVWIPRNVPHSTNVLSGSGHFVALRL